MDEHIKITELVEQEDGSAIMRCEMSEYVKNVLIEKAMITLINDHIDSLENTEHLK